MRRVLLYCLLTIGMNASAQTGAAYLKCFENNSNSTIEGLNIQLFSDSFCAEGFTTKDGSLLLRDLPVGELTVWIQNDDLSKTFSERIFIQENQLLSSVFFVDSVFLQVKSTNNLNAIQSGIALPNVTHQTEILTLLDRASMPIREIQMVTCTVRTPLLDFSNGYAMASTLSREDVMRLPTRTVNGIASTVGGVTTSEETGEVHFRGSRANDVAYYVDGMRVRNVSAVSKSSIDNVTVLTGGIPANYGDVTGGVIRIETKSYTRGKQIEPRLRKSQKYVEPKPLPPAKNYDAFLPIYENDFLSPVTYPNSTFGIDIDQASWSYVKNQLNNHLPVARDAVKLEEMINSFDYHVVDEPSNELINVMLERLSCAWNSNHQIVKVHLKAQDLPKDLPRKPHNFVFLIDVSGSMSSSNKLPLLVDGMKEFVKTLQPNDRVAIVTYAGTSGVVLEPTLCNEKALILNALDKLTSGGSTNGIGGIETAYNLAKYHYDPELNNRIILATDGDFNVGINSPGDLEKFIEQQRGQGIYLTALGFGMGNYKNSTLETLADKGDGNHFYIHSLEESKRVLVNEIGNLLTVARDVKLNVEFNPTIVKLYRLIGYENRLLKAHDFVDDTKDGGEMGYGHEVIAVYEIEMGTATTVETHFVQTNSTSVSTELAFVKLRYKPFEDKESIERRIGLQQDAPLIKNDLLNLVVGFGLQMRDSAFKGPQTLSELKEQAKHYEPMNSQETELVQLILNYTSN